MEQNQETLQEKLESFNNTKDTTQEYDPQDIDKNKVMAILAYFGILVFIPIFAAKDSKFARFHSNQGLILLIAAFLYYIAYTILCTVILAISWRLLWLTSIIGIIGLVFFVWFIIGIVNAAQGKAKELPFIGHFKLLKV